jgi:hypothetical protein
MYIQIHGGSMGMARLVMATLTVAAVRRDLVRHRIWLRSADYVGPMYQECSLCQKRGGECHLLDCIRYWNRFRLGTLGNHCQLFRLCLHVLSKHNSTPVGIARLFVLTGLQRAIAVNRNQTPY